MQMDTNSQPRLGGKVGAYVLPDNLRRPTPPDMGPKSYQRKVIFSYMADWGLVILFFIIFTILDKYVNGFKREFSLTDPSLMYPYAEQERIPIWMAVVIAGVVPFVIILFISTFMARNGFDAQCGALGMLFSVSLTWVIINTTKLCVGRPRPDAIDRCQPESGAHDQSPYGLSTYEICTQTDSHILDDGFKSFPSAHSGVAFAGLGYLSWYMAGKLRLYDGRGHVLKSWIAFCPFMGAVLIAVSRTMDYRHHTGDVFAGSLIGFVTSYFAYRSYYPPLRHENCHLPYPPRITPESLNTQRVSLGTHPGQQPVPQQAGPYNENDAFSLHNLNNEFAEPGYVNAPSSQAQFQPHFQSSSQPHAELQSHSSSSQQQFYSDSYDPEPPAPGSNYSYNYPYRSA